MSFTTPHIFDIRLQLNLFFRPNPHMSLRKMVRQAFYGYLR